MSGIPKITTEQFEDRMEWLCSGAGGELAEPYSAAARSWPEAEPWDRTIERLDEIGRVAKRCAKHLRELGEAI